MLTISRRGFLTIGTLLGARALDAPHTRPFFRRTGLPIGLQLYTVGDDLKRDFAGTLAAVSKIGYQRSNWPASPITLSTIGVRPSIACA